VSALAEAVAVVTGEDATLGARGAITDAGWFQRAGIPIVVFGPGDIEQAHAIDECVRVDALVEHCQAIALFLARHCRTEDDR
jgi:acetylornithine deacetylase/succinyl-diaminopimelate desuccinylase-like protein